VSRASDNLRREVYQSIRTVESDFFTESRFLTLRTRFFRQPPRSATVRLRSPETSSISRNRH